MRKTEKIVGESKEIFKPNQKEFSDNFLFFLDLIQGILESAMKLQVLATLLYAISTEVQKSLSFSALCFFSLWT